MRYDRGSLSHIKGMIFDMGNTLYESSLDLVRENRRFLSNLGLDELAELPDEEVRHVITDVCNPWLEDLMVSREVDPHWEPDRATWVEYNLIFLETLGAKGNIPKLADELQTMWDELIANYWQTLVPDCKPILQLLNTKERKLGIASNRFGDPKLILMRSSIWYLFKAIEYTNVPGYKKPSPYMLLQVAEMLDLTPESCAYVGNMVEADVVAAKRAGMIPILVVTRNPEEREKAPSNTVVIDELSYLLHLFDDGLD